MDCYKKNNCLCVFYEETSTSKVENNNFKSTWNQNINKLCLQNDKKFQKR